MGAHTTAEEREEYLDRYRRSDLTQREFCKREGISFGAFRSWRYKRNLRLRSEGPRFVEITSSSPTADSAAIELHIGELTIVLPTTMTDERVMDLVVGLAHRVRGLK